MIDEIKGRPMLDGVRGQPPADIAALQATPSSRSPQFVQAHPEVRELDLNPVFAYPDGALAVDARIVIAAILTMFAGPPLPLERAPAAKVGRPWQFPVTGSTVCSTRKIVVVVGDKGPFYMWLKNNMPFKEKGGKLYSVQLDARRSPASKRSASRTSSPWPMCPSRSTTRSSRSRARFRPYVLKDLIAERRQRRRRSSPPASRRPAKSSASKLQDQLLAEMAT